MSELTADDVLMVLGGLRPPPLSDLELVVMTEPAEESWSNMLQRVVPGPSWWPFEPGEVLVLDKTTGREPFGEGRKPDKWATRYERFTSLEAALARRAEVLELHRPALLDDENEK